MLKVVLDSNEFIHVVVVECSRSNSIIFEMSLAFIEKNMKKGVNGKNE